MTSKSSCIEKKMALTFQKGPNTWWAHVEKFIIPNYTYLGQFKTQQGGNTAKKKTCIPPITHE